MNVSYFGTKPKQRRTGEKFDAILGRNIKSAPKGRGCSWSVQKGIEEANDLGYPLLGPSNVCFGRSGVWEITRITGQNLFNIWTRSRRILTIPCLLTGIWATASWSQTLFATEQNNVYSGNNGHLERAGIHSGDSISIYPPQKHNRQISEAEEGMGGHQGNFCRIKKL